MRPLLFAVVLLSVGTSVPALTAESDDARMTADTLAFASLLASSCLASLRSPTGPGWLHEAKWNGYRVIARKDGERVRLWARMTSDYSNAFARIRNAVAALPVETAVL